MATSGQYVFNLTKNQIITRSLQMINVNDINETANTDDFSFASDLLNMMLKAWEAEPGMHLWKRRLAALFPQVGQNSYQLGSVTGADNCAITYVATTSTAATSGSTIVLSTITGMTALDNIGIELANGTRQWTTIVSINSGTKTVTLNASVTSTASSGATVITYTTLINRPLRILRGTLLDLSNSNTEVTMQDISYDEYFSFPIKSNPGRPNNFYYDRLLGNSLPYTGTLYVYPTPDSVNRLIVFSYCDSIQDMLNNGDTLDLPQEWLLSITANLAVLLGKWGYGKFQELQALEPTAQMYKEQMLDFDSDDSDITFKMDLNSQGINRP